MILILSFSALQSVASGGVCAVVCVFSALAGFDWGRACVWGAWVRLQVCHFFTNVADFDQNRRIFSHDNFVLARNRAQRGYSIEDWKS